MGAKGVTICKWMLAAGVLGAGVMSGPMQAQQVGALEEDSGASAARF